jgi:predicted thioesterase
MKQNLEIGLRLTEDYAIESEHGAKHVGSGEVQVLSTPAMILFMERTARQCVQSKLEDGYITVGIRVDVRHLNAAPIGETLRVIAQLTEIDGRRLTFKVRAEWQNEVIGEGEHERVIVNRDRFLQKLVEKTART